MFPQIQCTTYTVWNERESEICTLHRCSSLVISFGHIWNTLDSCWQVLVVFSLKGTGKYLMYSTDACLLKYTHTGSVFRIVGSQTLSNCLYFPAAIHWVSITPMEKMTQLIVLVKREWRGNLFSGTRCFLEDKLVHISSWK